MDLCSAYIVEHLASLADQPSWNLEGALPLAETFRQPAPESGTSMEVLLERLAPAVARSFTTPGPGYLAFIPGGGLPTAAMADFLACSVNRYVGVAKAAPVLSRIESTVVDWMTSMMGYPADAGGILTSGGSLSNLIALVTARTARLPQDFLKGTLYVSGETHLCVTKAARFAGFPEANIRHVPVDRRYRMIPDELEAAVKADRARGMEPFLVIPSVGTTNTGAVDPLPDILDVARRHDLWVHADAAYGGFFRLAPGGEALMPGIEGCDSITLDPHKGLFLPYGTGCLLVREPEALRRAHSGDADYLQDVTTPEGLVSFNEISPELSRDFRGLRVWLPVMLHGLAAFREQLGEKLELARWAHDELAAEPNLEMLDEPQLSVVAFTGKPAAGDPGEFGAELLRRVNDRRRVFLSSTRMGGRYVLRICVLSFRTHRDRVQEAVTALREEARALAGA
jgi:aromatic-L-amino-acid decarboxylase